MPKDERKQSSCVMLLDLSSVQDKQSEPGKLIQLLVLKKHSAHVQRTHLKAPKRHSRIAERSRPDVASILSHSSGKFGFPKSKTHRSTSQALAEAAALSAPSVPQASPLDPARKATTCSHLVSVVAKHLLAETLVLRAASSLRLSPTT